MGLNMDFESRNCQQPEAQKWSGVSHRVWYTFHGRVPGRKHMGPKVLVIFDL